MTSTFKTIVLNSLFASLAIFSSSVFAQALESPTGVWKTIDDETKQVKSIVRISESGGTFSGKIEKLTTPGRENAVCAACEGDLKDKPVTGMTIINGMKKADDGYEGGTIFDPNNGKTYKSKMKLIEGGKKLEVRGYIGPFSRAQIWVREQ
jgi:uncharacterized protein (DUF2147 family)